MLFQNKLIYAVVVLLCTSFFSMAQQPAEQPGDTAALPLYKEVGIASYYANKFNGRRTASGERFSQHRLTGAHRTLPFGTRVKVTNLKTGKWVIVHINDRGPYVKKRIIDLSSRAARHLGMVDGSGKARVRVEELPPQPEITSPFLQEQQLIPEHPQKKKAVKKKKRSRKRKRSRPH